MEFKTGDLERVLSICAEAASVPDAMGQTALFYAVQRASDREAVEVTQRLMSAAGIDPSRKDVGGQSPLFYAAATGNVETVKLLIASGCDANEADNLQQTPLFYACRDGRLAVVQCLIENGANPRHMDRNAQTALFYAARENRREICEFLVRYGSLPDHVDLTGRRPSFFAKAAGHTELAAWIEEQFDEEDSNQDRRKRCRLVFVSPVDGTHLTPTVEQLEFMETKYPEICIWNKQGPIATALPIPASLMGGPTTSPRPVVNFARKKSAVPATVAPPKPIWMTAARQMLSDLFKKEDAWIFLRPVDPVKDMCPDYLTVIKEPMDFATIRRKMAKYNSKTEFVHDIELVLTNCKTYNKPGTLPDVLCTRVMAFWNDLLERYSFEQIPDTNFTPRKEQTAATDTRMNE